ncbi:MAG: biotin--[acetyl-CoA-carboxylase] ligase [Gemmatimonadaceae bacterium]
MADAVEYDGVSEHALRRLLDVPQLSVHAALPSTMDLAHELAADGAPGGTLVLADQQLAGRGRGGRRWSSEPGGGLWFTLVERPLDPIALKVLSLRVGLRVAAALDRYLPTAVQLKWPNDLFVGSGKVAGILTEVRWKDGRPEWVAIGIGINVRPPSLVAGAAALGGCSRVDVLSEVMPAVRGAASAMGNLSTAELVAYASRDLALGRTAFEPGVGRVAGIDADGHLLIAGARGTERFASGSLELEDVIA